jgi:hypothetical protein
VISIKIAWLRTALQRNLQQIELIQVFILQQKHLIRFCSSGAPELYRRLFVVFFFVLLGSATAQQIDTNAPGSTNELSPQTIPTNQPPIGAPQGPYFQAQNALTNLFDVAPVLPPFLGPRTLGQPDLISPLGGTSVFAAPVGHGTGVGGSGRIIPLWGPIDLRASSLYYSYSYGNGIESLPGNQVNTSVQTISATFTFDLGTHWQLIYSPSYSVYSDKYLKNSLDHSLLLTGGTTYDDWAYNFSQSYVPSDVPLVETGTQTTQESYGTTFNAAHSLEHDLSLQLGVSQNINVADQFNTVESWSAESGINYQMIPQMGVGLMVSGNYNSISTGSSFFTESYQGTMNFHPRQKLSLTLSAGFEVSQFIDPSAPSLTSPIFSASLSYQLFRFTSLSVTASRSFSPSYYANQVEDVTAVGATLQQTISRKLSLSLNGGYSSQPLTSVVPGPLPQYFVGTPPTSTLTEVQNNTATTYGATLSYAILERLSISASYVVSQNSSSQANFKYSSTQMGLSLTYAY